MKGLATKKVVKPMFVTDLFIETKLEATIEMASQMRCSHDWSTVHEWTV